MEEELKVSENYKKWFNRGYELSQSMPSVLEKMTVQGEGTEKSKAFEAGRKQFELDHQNREKEKDDALLMRFKAKRERKNRGRGR